MYKSKLISALRTLSNKELKWFDYYIHSPFFNKNENVIKLFDILQKYHPEYEESKVEMEKILPQLFPKEKTDIQKLRYVMTDLTKLLEDYLTYTEFQKNDTYQKHLLLNAYNSRGLDKQFLSILEEANDKQRKQPYRDVNYFFNQHLLEENAYIHSLSRKPRSISSSLQEAVDNLDYYYLSNRLRYSCAIMDREALLQEKYNNFFLDEILNFLSKRSLETTPSVSIYHRIAMMYVEADQQEHYYKLKNLLHTYKDSFPMDEVKDMYTYALNYCIRQLNAGHLNFLNEMMDLYKVLIASEIIFDEGYLSPNTFKNIVTIGLRSNEEVWVESFIHNYKERILPEFRESTYVYNLANFYYYKKDFSRALKLLQTVELNDIYYHLGAKALLLKTYYELEETEPFYSLVDAFTNYLKRNKLISNTLRAVNLNFVKYAKKLMQLRLGGRITSEELRKEMQQLTSIGNLQWLQEKLEEIEKSQAGAAR